MERESEQNPPSPAKPALGPAPAERLWTSRDVCAFLGVGKNAPNDLARRGELPAMRIGRRLRFDPAAVRAFAERHQHGADVVTLAGRRGT